MKNVVKDELKEIVKECKISQRKAEEMFNISMFYGDTCDEAKENIKNFLIQKNLSLK